jgi:hypothetical protein
MSLCHKHNQKSQIKSITARAVAVIGCIALLSPRVISAQGGSDSRQCEGQIAFTNLGAGFSIHLIDTDGSGEVQLTSIGNRDYLTAEHPSWSPDGTRIVFQAQVYDPYSISYYNTDLFVMDADGSNLWTTELDFIQYRWSILCQEVDIE